MVALLSFAMSDRALWPLPIAVSASSSLSSTAHSISPCLVFLKEPETSSRVAFAWNCVMETACGW